MPLRVVFMGTPDFAVPALATLLGSGHEIVAVYTQPPRPAGRGLEPRPSPVETLARGAGLSVLAPVSLRGEPAAATFAGHDADVAVVVAYGLILPQAILDTPRHGCLNLHPSKLPRWRGAAPIQRTLMAGDSETAVCVMRMEAGLDTGPVCLAEPLAIAADMTAGMLHDLAAHRGGDLMLRALGALERGSLDCRAQSDDGVTYAAKIDKAEARIDWTRPAKAVHDLAANRGGDLLLRALGALERGSLDCRAQSDDGVTYAAKIDKAEARIDWTRPAKAVHDHIRGLSPFPGAWFEVARDGKPERIKVLRSQVAEGHGEPGLCLDNALTIACADGAVRLLQLQRAGKTAMTADDFQRGFPLAEGAAVA